MLIARAIVVWIFAQCALAASDTTVYPYEIDESIVAAKDYKTFIIASHNLGKPARQYLSDYEQRIDEYVIKYLNKKGYKVLDDRIYSQALSVSEAEFGDPFDPSSGKIDMKKKQQVLADVRYVDCGAAHQLLQGAQRVGRRDGICSRGGSLLYWHPANSPFGASPPETPALDISADRSEDLGRVGHDCMSGGVMHSNLCWILVDVNEMA